MARTQTFKALVCALLGIGLFARIAPLLDRGGRLMQQWPSEDGYFMLTMARNIALGRGLSTAGGAIPTNGTQPLATLLWSLAFRLTGSDREDGVLLILILLVLINCATAFILYRLALKILHRHEHGPAVSAFAAALWFASPTAIPHSMNCLETGVYGLVAVAIGYVFVEFEGTEGSVWSFPRSLAVGVLLGIGFWVRNDACFLIAAACLTYLYTGLEQGRDALKARFIRTLFFGATSVVVASPWLIYNQINFGHIVPVSGRAESLTGSFGGNIGLVPSVLLEYLFVLFPIPQSLQEKWPVGLACGLAILVLAPSLRRLWKASPRVVRTALCLFGIYAVGLSIFYGLFFGAGWFMARYLFPLSTFLAIGFATLVFAVKARLPRIAGPVATAAMLIVIVGLQVRMYDKGDRHQHFQVVRWVTDNVPPKTWIGAIQTGTLGFYHDRTINLDGKVNRAAYDALIAKRLDDYVANDTEIEYLADWVGLVDWMQMDGIANNFDILVKDPEQNLTVLRRKSGAPQ